MDTSLQEWEHALTLDPSNSVLRQQILTTYLNLGQIDRNDLFDLAALKDPGAIAITGKTPDLESRSKRFYIRCAWIVVQDAQSHLSLELCLAKPGQELLSLDAQKTLDDLCEKIFDAINIFNQLLMSFLNRDAVLKEAPIKFFRPGALAKLNHFYYVFGELKSYLQDARLLLVDDGTPSPYEALGELLSAYRYLAESVGGKVKARTDEAIHHAGRSIDYSLGIEINVERSGLLPGSLRWSQELSIIRGGEKLSQNFASLNEYYLFHSQELLQNNRNKIIRFWLPGYTP